MAKKMNSAKLKKKLWLIFSEFIRLRDSADGFGTCIACKKRVPYPNSTGAFHAGHFYPKSTTFANLYFSEINVNGECAHCNTFLEGNTMEYAKGLKEKYGDEIIDHLDYEKSLPLDPGFKHTYGVLIEHYTKLVKEMKQERGL